MLFITAQSLPSFLSFPAPSLLPRLKPRQVPLTQWALHVLLLTTGSLLNNWAFAFDVPLTVQIVFRSAGLAISMLFGAFFLKKRYSTTQVISVIIVSVGAILAALSRPPVRKTAQASLSEDGRKYTIGVAMLVISLLLTAALGLLQERTYQKYGPCWRESVFYSHFLSLPVFLFLIPDVKQGVHSLSETSPYASYLIMAGNLVSQLICVSSVNRLSSQVSSVSTNLVLTTRKALSLCFSVWWFGNGWNAQLGIGAGMVFFGSFIFTTKPSMLHVEKKYK
jgi:UDP-xylose/UDP-N-acetylglucosamine transporter B4